MKTRQTRFDLFGEIVNGYPSKVYKNTHPIVLKTKKSPLKAEAKEILGEISNFYPSKVYKAPGSQSTH